MQHLNGILRRLQEKRAGVLEPGICDFNARKAQNPFSGRGKEATGMRDYLAAYPNLMFPASGRELAPAPGIDDPGPVAVASQGSSLSHSA